MMVQKCGPEQAEHNGYKPITEACNCLMGAASSSVWPYFQWWHLDNAHAEI